MPLAIKVSVSTVNDDDSGPKRPPTPTERLAAWYDDNPARFWVAVTLGPIALAALGVLAAPELVWDGFIWKYLWGPIVADAQGHPVQQGGVVAQAGYTVFSYLVYGPVLLVALFGLKEFLDRYDLDVDGRFVLALGPMMIFGALLRVMEDTLLFEPPLQYVMISPLIYFVLAGITVGALALGLLARRVHEAHGTEAALTVLAVPALAFIALGALLASGIGAGTLAYVPPVYVVAFATLLAYGVVAVDTWRRDDVDPVVVGFGVGVAALLLVLYAMAWWIVGDPWSAVGVGRTYATTVLPVGILGAVAIAGGVAGVLWLLDREDVADAGIFLSGTAVAMLLGHALDAWATTLAIANPLGFPLGAYSEKHPASNFLISELGWPVWIAVKVGLVLAIVWLFEVEYEDDFEDNPAFAGLIKLAVIVLGLGPGTRNLGRITLGV